MSKNDTEYSPFNDDLPRVQIPLGANRAGLSIDGEFMTLIELPEDARDAYRKYAEQGGNVRIYQCDRCGYLSDADAFSATSYDSYDCGGCGTRLIGSTQNPSTTSYTRVHGPHLAPDDEQHVDVLAVVADEDCPEDHPPTIDTNYVAKSARAPETVVEAAVECDACVPNHPSHLGRLQNQVEGEITQDEMLQQVAVAVKEFREA